MHGLLWLVEASLPPFLQASRCPQVFLPPPCLGLGGSTPPAAWAQDCFPLSLGFFSVQRGVRPPEAVRRASRSCGPEPRVAISDE